MPGSLLNTNTTSNTNAETPSESPGPTTLTRQTTSPQITTNIPSGSKKNSLDKCDSPLHSVYPSTQGSESDSADEGPSIMLQGHQHGQRTDSPASSAMAVHGSTPPSMIGCEGAFGAPHPQKVMRTNKWQESGVDAKTAKVVEEHGIPSISEEALE